MGYSAYLIPRFDEMRPFIDPPPMINEETMETLPKLFPVQMRSPNSRERATISEPIMMRAYEVYSAIYGPQEALITGWCRGGFGNGELIAFLYARSFPKEEWRVRVEEALRGLKGIDR